MRIFVVFVTILSIAEAAVLFQLSSINNKYIKSRYGWIKQYCPSDLFNKTWINDNGALIKVTHDYLELNNIKHEILDIFANTNGFLLVTKKNNEYVDFAIKSLSSEKFILNRSLPFAQLNQALNYSAYDAKDVFFVKQNNLSSKLISPNINIKNTLNTNNRIQETKLPDHIYNNWYGPTGPRVYDIRRNMILSNQGTYTIRKTYQNSRNKSLNILASKNRKFFVFSFLKATKKSVYIGLTDPLPNQNKALNSLPNQYNYHSRYQGTNFNYRPIVSNQFSDQPLGNDLKVANWERKKLPEFLDGEWTYNKRGYNNFRINTINSSFSIEIDNGIKKKYTFETYENNSGDYCIIYPYQSVSGKNLYGAMFIKILDRQKIKSSSFMGQQSPKNILSYPKIDIYLKGGLEVTKYSSKNSFNHYTNVKWEQVSRPQFLNGKWARVKNGKWLYHFNNNTGKLAFSFESGQPLYDTYQLKDKYQKDIYKIIYHNQGKLNVSFIKKWSPIEISINSKDPGNSREKAELLTAPRFRNDQKLYKVR